VTEPSRIAWWGSASNRHVRPLLDALETEGWLDHAWYGASELRWQQLGTRAPLAPYEEVLSSEADVTGMVAGLDAVHVIHGFAGWLCKAAMRACTRSGARFFLFSESLSPRAAWSPLGVARNVAYRRMTAGAAGAFALSRYAAEDYARIGMPRERIHPGMYAGPASPDSGGGVADGPVAFAGRLVPRKGLDLLFRAAARLGEEGRPVPLEIVGTGPEEERLRAMARGLGLEARFRGQLESREAKAVMERSSAVVLPSRDWEGWGYVVNEALALGVPVVVSDRVGAAELVVPGQNGAVFVEDDVAGLVEALRLALGLHGNPTALAGAMAASRRALDPAAFARYVHLVATSAWVPGEAPAAPWHEALRPLGPSSSIRWWDDGRRRRIPRNLGGE
jgi:glycosyltransferase involved in cell wall biosynthesis